VLKIVKNNRFSSISRPKRKNRLLIWSLAILFLILISCFIYGVTLYNDLYDSKTAGFDETREQILNQTSITEIDKIEQFNGEKAYHVIYGENNKGEQKIIFYPLEGKEKNLTTIDATEIVSEEKMLELWKEDCESCDFINISSALIDGKALWEISYKDDKDRYVLEYFSMNDGTRYEQYRFNSMFK